MPGTHTLLVRPLLSSRRETGGETKNFPLGRRSFFPAVKAGSSQSIPTPTPMMPRRAARADFKCYLACDHTVAAE